MLGLVGHSFLYIQVQAPFGHNYKYTVGLFIWDTFSPFISTSANGSTILPRWRRGTSHPVPPNAKNILSMTPQYLYTGRPIRQDTSVFKCVENTVIWMPNKTWSSLEIWLGDGRNPTQLHKILTGTKRKFRLPGAPVFNRIFKKNLPFATQNLCLRDSKTYYPQVSSFDSQSLARKTTTGTILIIILMHES